MYHLTKSGKRGYCRAIVRPCPLGGESAFFKNQGISGPARPTAPQAKETGVYDKVYGAEKTRQERIKEKRKEREADKGVNSSDKDNGYSEEYNEKLSNVKKELEEFNNKHSDHLNNSSGYYFMANQKLSYRDEEYLSDLDKVGESVNTLVSDKVNANPQIAEDRKEYNEKMEKAVSERQEYIDKHEERLAVIEKDFQDGNIMYGEYVSRYNSEVRLYNREIGPYSENIDKVNKDYSSKYESTYGKAYKEALSDLGVEFSNGEEMYSRKVYNQDTVSDEFANDVKSAIDYYPNEWVGNIDSKLSVHEYMPEGRRLGYVNHYEGRMYEASEKRVKLFSSNHSTTVHEFGHVIELNNPEIGRAERLFLIQEKQKSSFKKVRDVRGSGGRQKIATDSLVREYSGVYYSGGSSKNDRYDGNTYEIFTTGVENLFTADSGGFTTDETCKSPQHRNFILGLFATSVRK